MEKEDIKTEEKQILKRLERKDDVARQLQKFRKYTTKTKKVTLVDVIRAFNETFVEIAKLTAGEEAKADLPTDIKDINSLTPEVGRLVEQIKENPELSQKSHLNLFKLTLRLVKAFTSRTGENPSNELTKNLNNWTSSFWDPSLKKENREKIYKQVKASVQPFYDLDIKGSNLELTVAAESDYEKQYTENIDKLMDQKSYKNLPDYEKWGIKHKLKDIASNAKHLTENISEKASMAIKRSAGMFHDIVQIKHSKNTHSEKNMVGTLKNIFETHSPPSSGYSLEFKNDVQKLLKIYTRSYDKIESIKAVFDTLANLDGLIPSTLINPNIKRNFIGFVYTVLEPLIKKDPAEFYGEFCTFLILISKDLREQAEESINENDPLFLENFQRCYMKVPEMILCYSDDADKFTKIMDIFTTEFRNSKFSIYQLYVMFTSLSMIARSKNQESDNTKFFSIEVNTKKYALTVCVDGSLDKEADSVIMKLKRTIDTNTISFDLKGRYTKKYKVDDSVNKSYVRSLMDPKQGVTKDDIHKWKVVDESKMPGVVLYAQIAVYTILKDSIAGERLDKKNYVCDTLLNFALVNSATMARHAIDVLGFCALRAPAFFQETLFTCLCQKMTEFEESFHDAEREKSSDYLMHPHKVRSIKVLVNRVLHGHYVNSFRKDIFKPQDQTLDTKGLILLSISVCSPAVYNFVEKGNVKYKVIKSYLDSIQKHYEDRNTSFNEMLHKISEPMIAKLSTRMFMFSDRHHMRTICVNVCGTISSLSEEFYDIVSQTFKLNMTIEQVKKCLKCKEMFRDQYSHITFYDMNHIADSANALLQVFSEKMKAIEEAKKQEGPEEEEEIKVSPEAKAAPKKKKDINKLLLGVGTKKGKKGKKGTMKDSKPAKETKPVEKSKPKPEPEKPVVEENKDERMKRDLRTVNTFLDHTFARACTYIHSICKIYELASKGKSDELLDKIIYQNIHIFIELLRYPSCNFIIKSKLPQLLDNNSGENKILKIRNCIIECLLQSARLLNGKTLSKDEVDKEFKVFFRIISDNSFDFSKLGKGMIRLILTNVNFAIKHNHISHTYKENAVSIAHQILKDSDKYEPVDMLRVAQTLLKQDYVASGSYKFLSALFNKSNDEERLLLCLKIFDYHLLQLTNFFQVMFDYNGKLPRSEALEVQIWIMQFEEIHIGEIAKKVWGKYYSEEDITSAGKDTKKRIRVFTSYAIDNFGMMSKSTAEAFVAAINIDNALIHTYIDSIDEILQDCTDHNEKDEQLKFFAEVVNLCANKLEPSQLEKLFEFIIYEGYLNPKQEVSQAFEKCGINICIEQGERNTATILDILKGYLLNPLKDRKDLNKNKENQVLNESLILISVLAKYFDKSDAATLDIYERIIEMLNIQNKELKKSISKCISPLSNILQDKSKKFLRQLLNMLLKSKDLSTITGAAYAVSGVVKGLGSSTIEEFKIFDTLEEKANDKKAAPHNKIALLNCFEAFASTLGKSFELYLERVVPQILAAFSDNKDSVRNAGKKALDSIMNNISGYCVRNIISSIFLQGIEEANWRTKLGQIEALCSMAMFAPNQVAGHLPQVINSIRAILLDTHPKVQEAGQDALNKITSAMRNQGRLNALAILEVHSEQIAKSSATENLQKALDHLLDTTFVHSLDEPSLALLMPLIKDGLEAVNRKIQIKALRIIGYLCSIILDPSIFMPYLKDIAPIMVNLLLTVHPKLRSASCKALAGLVKGLGVERCLGMCKWICKQLREASVTDSRNTQFEYEEIPCEGKTAEEVWREELAYIHEMATHDTAAKRIAGVTLLVDFHRFVSCFKNYKGCKMNFTDYAHKVIPMFEDALLDMNEDVRAGAVKGCKLVIETFGEDFPDLIFTQLLRGYSHGNYWVRYHTIVLISTLLHILGGNIHKLKKDEEKGQEGVITCYEEIICCIYILSYDLVERVSFTASSAWQIFVEKRQGKYLVAPFDNSKAALDKLVYEMINIISSEYQEVVTAGTRTLNSLMGKLFTKLLEQSLNIMDNSFGGIDKKTAVARFNYFYHLIEACDENIAKFRKRIEGIISKMIVHETREIKEMSSQVFKIFKKTLDNEDFVKDFIKDNFCSNADEEDPGLLEKKMTFLHALIDDPALQVSPILTTICLNPKDDSEELYYSRAKLLRLLGDRFLPDPAKMLTLILRLILDGEALLEIEETSKYVANDTYVTMGQSKEVIDELTLAIKPLIAKIPNEKIYEWHEEADELYKKCVQKNKVGVYVVFISEFIHHPRFQADSFIDVYLKNVCGLMDTQDPELLDKVINCIDSGATMPSDPDVIEEYLCKEWQNSFVKIFRQEVEEKMGLDEDDESYDTDKLSLLESAKGVGCISKIFLNTLLNGKADVRLDSAYNIGVVARFAPLSCYKKYAIKMAGALIRIANDKFDDDMKITIFRALRRMFEHAGIVMKPMAAPLKTTFSQFAKNKDISEEVKEEMSKLQEVVEAATSKKRAKISK